MKKRTLTISLIVLAIMLLVGIGYAGWVITKSDSGEANGNFEAYAVDDTLNLVVANTANNGVKFGWADASPAISNPWLTLDSENVEDLDAEFTVTWSGGAQDFTLTHTFLYGNEDANVDPMLIGAPEFSIVGSPAPSGVSIVNNNTLRFTSDYTANTTITIKVSYSFGTLFGGINPYQFFNPKGVNTAAFENSIYSTTSLTLSSIQGLLGNTITASSTYADVAAAALSKLDETVTGSGTALTFKVAVAKA